MAPRKMTAQQRSTMLQQMSTNTLVKANELLVKEAMRLHGEVAVSLCVRALSAQGIITDRSTIALAPPRPSSIGDLPALQNEPASNPSWRDGLGATWAQCQVRLLCQALCAVDEIAMFGANLKKLGRKHAREPNKGAILTLWEFVFRLDKDAATGEWSEFEAMVMFLVLRYAENGYRARFVALPIDYLIDGVYGLLEKDLKTFLVHRFEETEFEIVDAAGRELWIEHNYSDRKATVQDKSDLEFEVLCCSGFPELFRSTDQKRQARKREVTKSVKDTASPAKINRSARLVGARGPSSTGLPNELADPPASLLPLCDVGLATNTEPTAPSSAPAPEESSKSDVVALDQTTFMPPPPAER